MVILNYFYYLHSMILTNVYEKVAKDLDLPVEVVKKIYLLYWKFIRDTITKLPLDDNLTEEEFNNLKLNFNIPSLGKLGCTYNKYVKIKECMKK